MRVQFFGPVGMVAMMLLAGTASASPILWTLNNVTFEDGGTATGSFVFDPDQGVACSTGSSPCGTFGSVNITTSLGSTLDGATFQDVCGMDVVACSGVSPDSTQVLFLTSNVADQTGNRAIAFFFTAAGPLPPAGLTNSGGIIDIGNGAVGVVLEAFCSDAACSSPGGEGRASIAGTVVGTVVGSTVPEPASLTLLGLALAGMGARRWRQRNA